MSPAKAIPWFGDIGDAPFISNATIKLLSMRL